MDTVRWTTDLLSGETARHTESWLPHEAGQWRIRGYLERTDDATESDPHELIISVMDDASRAARVLPSVSGGPMETILASLLLLLLFMLIRVIGAQTASSPWRQ